jgi:hypothetical protein
MFVCSLRETGTELELCLAVHVEISPLLLLLLQVVEFLPGNCAPTKDVKALARAVKANRK